MSFWQAAPSSSSAPQPRDPRTGKMQLHRIWSNLLTNGAQCPEWERPSKDQPRCLLAEATPVWVAYRLTNNVWTTWADEQTGPFWVRKESDNEIKDGASNSTTYLYDLAQQNGGQFGNVTQVQESADGALLRTTVTEYFPNAAANIVNKPARVRVYQGAFVAAAPLNNCLAETRTIYDNMEIDYNSLPSKGLVAKTQQAITACASATTIGMYDANWQETRMAYDSHGNQTNLHHVGASATDGNDWLHTDYDSYYQLFPIRQWKGQDRTFAETAAYYGVNGNGPNDAPYGTNSASVSDPKAYWGAMAEHCAVNEVCTRQAYDNFGRRTLRWDNVSRGNAWDTDANASVLWTYRNPKMNAGFKTTVVTEAHAPRCEGNFVRKHYNGLGQLVAEQKPDQDWTWTADDCTLPIQLHEIETLYAYNALGQQTRASVPYRATENWVSRIAAVKWNTVWNSTPNTAIVYDPLGRPTRSIAPNDEFTRYDYLRRASTSKTKERTKSDNDPDAYRANWWKELDGLGNVANIRTWTYIGQDPNRPPRDPWVETTRVNFTHDATGNLTKVEHPIGLSIGTTTMTYDLLGHKLSMNDVDMGSWSYAYDRQGKLTRQTDARNQTTCLYYENVLERVSGKFFTTGPSCPASATSYDITYQYDQNQSSTNRSRGQLTYVTKNGWNKQIYYQAQGLLAEELVNIQGAPQSYATYYGYDAYWRPNTIIYPNGETVTTSYNGMGLPTRLNSSWWGTTPMIDQASYDELGRPTAMYLPDAHHWRSYTYWPWTGPDGNSNRRLQYIAYGDANDSASKLVVGNYYDSFGNITVSDRDFSRSAFDHGAFTYDAQNRLTSGYGLNYAYDNAGRLTAYEGNGLTAYPGHPHAMVKGVSNYAFDANGNMTKRAGGQILTWDAENHLSSVSGNGSTESYWYDADGQRVKQTVNGVTTFYPNQYVEQTGAQITQYHYFNGQRVSLHTNAPGYWIHYDLHVDQLGSTVLTTYQGGSPLTRQNYYAYGNYRPGDNGLQTDHRFTGQQQDTSGLVYMNARYYDPQIGQFISPDALVPDAMNVFDYNRYMYARGNPMKYTDPTGHYSDSALMTHFGCKDWACVEANFQEGGAYAGLWGWLYTLQQAVDGDTVGATFMAQNTGNAYLSGQFQRNANGKILIHATSYVGPTGGNSLNALMPENAFANFAANGDYGLFDLQGQQASFGVGRDALHNYLSLAPGTLLLTAAKAGTSLGPVIQNAGMAACATLIGCSGGAVVSTVGKAYTLVGWSVTLANDYVLPLLTSGDFRTPAFNGGVEMGAQAVDMAGATGKMVAPFIGPTVDIIQGLCYGTGCRR